MRSDDILTKPAPKADARLPYGADPNQFGDLRLPRTAGLHRVVMNIHGGFWRNKYDLGHAGHLCAALTAKGLATWNVEYRRVGDEGGGWPSTFEDIAAAYRFIPQIARKYSLDPTKVLVMGHSAGGQLALCLAAHEQSVERSLALAGVVDLQRAWELHLSNNAVAEFLGGPPDQVADHYREADPMRLSVKGRQWVVHGKKDNIVPPEFSKRYSDLKKGKGERIKLVEIEDADHFDLINPQSAAWGEVERAVLESFS